MIYRFADYELDDSTRELRGGGRPIETEPKAFDLLVYLVRHRDRAVSKDEILDAIWPNQIVSETALSRAVMKARRAVGDDSNAQSIIRTLHGHGYRFIADVSAEAEDPARTTPSSPPGTASASAPVRKRRLGLWLAAAAVGLALAIGLVVDRDTLIRLEPGALAVLPVNNQTDATDADWVRLGLMSLMQRMLVEGGIDVASHQRVLSAIGDDPLLKPPDSTLLERIRAVTGAQAVLHTTLDLKGGLYRLTAVITHTDGSHSRRIIVGQTPAAIAADIANVIVGIVNEEHSDPSARFSMVSTDPFINEMYARALDLELRGEVVEAREMFRLASREEPELFWLRYEIALCTRDLDEHDEADRLFRELYDEAQRGQDARAVVATLNSHGRQKLDLLEFDEAEALFQQALEAIGERPLARERATVQVNLALVDSWQGNDVAAAEHYDAVFEAYADADIEPSPLFLNNYAGLLNRLGKSEEALAYSERAVAGIRVLGQRRYEAPALNRLATIHRRLGNYETAIDLHEQARAIYADLGNERGELSVLSGITAVYRKTGDLTRARRNAEDVLERSLADPDNPVQIAHAYIELALVESDDARFATAIEWFEKAATAFANIDDSRGVREAHVGIANAAIATGDSARAHALAATILDAAGDDESATARAHWLDGRAFLAEAAYQAARQKFSLALDYARLRNDSLVLSHAGAGFAETCLLEGELAEARQHLEEIRPHAGNDHDFQRLDARLTRAEGDPDQAVEILMTLRTAAGESWKPDDEALLAELRSTPPISD